MRTFRFVLMGLVGLLAFLALGVTFGILFLLGLGAGPSVIENTILAGGVTCCGFSLFVLLAGIAMAIAPPEPDPTST